MKVAIVGSRDGITPGVVEAFVVNLRAKYPDAVIVSGGARGVDRRAELSARELRLDRISFRPEEGEQIQGARIFGISRFDNDTRTGAIPEQSYTSYGQAAFARNRLIVSEADVVVAFTTGSRGTANSIEIARELGKPVFVYDAAGNRVS